MLQLREINQAYGPIHTLWDINLTIESSHCAAILGERGTGKTTLFNCILGLLPISSGEMLWHPRNMLPCSLADLACEQRAQLGINYVAQGRPLFSQMTVEDNLLIALKSVIPQPQNLRIPAFILTLYPELLAHKQTRAGQLDASLQWQLAIARAAITRPKLLLLDEPSEGLSREDIERLAYLLSTLAQQQEMGILIMDSSIDFVQQCADSFILLHHGRNVLTGNNADLRKASVTQHGRM